MKAGWLGSTSRLRQKPLRPKEHIEAIAPMLPTQYSPIQKNGNGNQGCYLAGIPDALGHLLLALMDVAVVPGGHASPLHINDADDAGILEDIHVIEADISIPETQRLQLAKARIGQGLFRKRVLLLGPHCRVTGVEDSRLLVASHIKPWKDASNAERINGYNGIMLSPHVDALFDEKLMTFEEDGRIHIHPSLPPDVLRRWSIDPSQRVAAFRPEHAAFLKHHREAFSAKAA
jgi:hypothetical protein